ncbi:MAG: SAM-dependent methyltransferase [Cytophagaceae bacterium]|jgi:SAM-dependent methyltransferase|nr:SAM-dependent methyltransferase [Cytophagaceae bacterium]
MKKIISWVLRNIPRPVLQLITPVVMFFVRIFYTGNKVECTVCNSTYRSFLPYGRLQPRQNALCPNCLSLERHRLIILYLKNKTDFFSPGKQVLHIAPEHCFIRSFESLHKDGYITGDLYSPLAKVKMDVHAIPFPEDQFDVVFCNHVLEHVTDDRLAVREIRRVLKPGGFAILQSPADYRVEKTYEDPTITDPLEREKAFGQNDHMRLFGRDYGQRLGESGLKINQYEVAKELSKEQIERFRLDKGEILYCCVK